MHKFGKLIMELDRADCAYLQIYENGVVMVGRQVESEYGFDGFWGKIAKKALSEQASIAGKNSGKNMTPEQRSARAKKAVQARIAKQSRK